MTTIEQYLATWPRTEGPGEHMGKTESALRAVAELHPVEAASMTAAGEDVSLICAGCTYGRGVPTLVRDCAERRAIHHALGIDGKDQV